jgi:hypothetical protein
MSEKNLEPPIPFLIRVFPRLLVALTVIGSGLFLDQRRALSEEPAFEDVQIRPPFHNALLSDPAFMRRGGARVVVCKADDRLILGVGKVLVQPGESTVELTRKGEIQARATLLEFSNGAELRRYQSHKETTVPSPGDSGALSVSSFFDIAQSKVEGKIRQLPVVGTWRSHDFKFLYVAVGAAVDRAGRDITETLPSSPDSNHKVNHPIQGEEPFVSLLRLSPALCRSGGFRGFLWNGKRALIFVGLAPWRDSLSHAIRQAQLKAVRSMLEQEQGIEIMSLTYLRDQEIFQANDKEERRMLLNEFLSIDQEKVAGLVKTLAMVAYWLDGKGETCHVAIGKLVFP